MKLKDYIKQLKDLESKGLGDLDVVYASDDEGNNYEKVHFSPSLINLDEDMESVDEDDLDEYDITQFVCIN